MSAHRLIIAEVGLGFRVEEGAGHVVIGKIEKILSFSTSGCRQITQEEGISGFPPLLLAVYCAVLSLRNAVRERNQHTITVIHSGGRIMRRLFWASAVLAAVAIASPVASAGDREIAQSIVQKLETEKQAGKLKGFGIDLEVDEGVVTVSGQVATRDQQRSVLEIARWTTGVTKVKNGIQVNESLNGSSSVPSSSVPMPSSRQAPAASGSPAATGGLPTSPSFFGSSPQNQAAKESSRARAEESMRAREAKEAEIRAARYQAIEQQDAARRDKEALVREMLEQERMVRQASASQADLEASYVLPASAVGGSNPIPAPPSQKSVLKNASTQQHFQPLPGRQASVPVPSNRLAQAPAYMGSAPVYRNQASVSGGYPVHPAVQHMQGQPYMQQAGYGQPSGMPAYHGGGGQPMQASYPPGYVPVSGGVAPARYDHPNMPAYSWPSYAAHPNYAAVTYPKQYSAQAWPYIGPFHPYPQVPLGWRKVTLEWDDGWWMLDFKSK